MFIFYKTFITDWFYLVQIKDHVYNSNGKVSISALVQQSGSVKIQSLD